MDVCSVLYSYGQQVDATEFLTLSFSHLRVFEGTLSQSFTFVLGKYLLRDAVVAFVSKRYKSFQTIDAAIAQQGMYVLMHSCLSHTSHHEWMNRMENHSVVALVSHPS